MTRTACVGIIAMVLFGVPIQSTIQAQTADSARTFLDKHTAKVFDDAGVQMELPDVVPFESTSKKDVLIMLHPTGHGEKAEQGYCVKIHVRRLSKAELDSNKRLATNLLTDDFNKWYTTNHSSLDVRKTPKLWCVRKDVPTPDGLSLFTDCQVTVTKSADADLLETKRIIESIKALR